jgi:hypothetical protein
VVDVPPLPDLLLSSLPPQATTLSAAKPIGRHAFNALKLDFFMPILLSKPSHPERVWASYARVGPVPPSIGKTADRERAATAWQTGPHLAHLAQ